MQPHHCLQRGSLGSCLSARHLRDELAGGATSLHRRRSLQALGALDSRWGSIPKERKELRYAIHR